MSQTKGIKEFPGGVLDEFKIVIDERYSKIGIRFKSNECISFSADEAINLATLLLNQAEKIKTYNKSFNRNCSEKPSQSG